MRMRGNKTRIIFFSLGFLLLINSSCTVWKVVDDVKVLKTEMRNPRSEGEARLEMLDEVPVLHLYGTPEEMGSQYGTIMKKELNSLFDILFAVFSEKRLNYYAEFADSVESNLPVSIRSELQAISNTSGVDYTTLVAFNMLPRMDCSTLAVWGDATRDGRLIMGRNADYTSKGVNEAAGIIVVRHPNEGIPTISISYLGMVGAYSGVTADGVSFGNMLVYNGRNDDINYNGLSVQLVMRLAAEKSKSAKEMEEYIHLYKHMIPINVMCADDKEAFLIELDQEDIVVREGENGVLAAANSFISDEMTDEPKKCHRYRKIMKTVDEHYGEMGVREVKEAMIRARRHGRRNIQCIIFEPAKRRMHVSINKIPAAKGPYKVVDINRLFEN